jgi:hypothetical protein
VRWRWSVQHDMLMFHSVSEHSGSDIPSDRFMAWRSFLDRVQVGDAREVVLTTE